MSSRCIRALSLFLIFAIPASLLSAETHAAMVFASGIASLNGNALPRSTAIFAGDVLETSKNSGIILNATGSTVQVGANSRVKFQGDAIDLNNGVAQITTQNRMKVTADALVVTPKEPAAKYQVAHLSGKVTVSALSGTVSVLNGNSSELLAAGEAKTFSEDPQQEDKDKKNRDRVGAVYVSDKTMFIWSAAALGTGGVLAWWLLRDGRKPLSNQLP